MVDVYLDAVARILAEVQSEEGGSLTRACALLAGAVETDRIIYTFGTGHSSLLAAEGLFRAGGLAPVSAMLEPSVTFEGGAVASGLHERLAGADAAILDRYPVTEGDALVVFTNSGVNAVPVELAERARGRGARVVAVVSRRYAEDAARRKGVKRSIADVAEVVIDNHLPPGDALVRVADGLDCAPGSTVVGAAIWNALVAGVVQTLVARGRAAPVYVSSNMPGAEAGNEVLVRRYRNRIRYL